MQTLEKFLHGNDLAMRCRPVVANGDPAFLIAEPWAPQQYSCQLYRAAGPRPITAILGSDNGAPELGEVLTHTYEQWAQQMGFDPDSRQGERVYRAARREAKRLHQLLGDEQYTQLLWQTERL